MRKFLLLVVGVLLGAVAAYLFDPDRGRTRRAKFADQASARGRDVTDSMRKTVEYQKGVAKGVIHDVSQTMSPHQHEYDDKTLLQKVRSEALGSWKGGPIEVDITDGTVRVSGSVDDDQARDRLLELIRSVDGVGLIDDRISVKA